MAAAGILLLLLLLLPPFPSLASVFGGLGKPSRSGGSDGGVVNRPGSGKGQRVDIAGAGSGHGGKPETLTRSPVGPAPAAARSDHPAQHGQPALAGFWGLAMGGKPVRGGRRRRWAGTRPRGHGRVFGESGA
ncbi:hypothetical protein SELMODRAFT_432220 [Selaginella moellendorffii]|uniref:Uncharacterized protein n=1 Tax=Selaginella moellendorffii TaxID=88036 RepID=D8TFC3_SELML|nr:hypothetical protein SELMODRAFT_432220 [Selaginella moellendorffii]